MAASPKYQWNLAKYAKYVFSDDRDFFEEEVDETVDVPFKGRWKIHTGEDKELILSLLVSDHFLITHNDIILESFSLTNSSTWLKGVARNDSLMMVNKLKDGSSRRFRIQFDRIDEWNDGACNRKHCTDLLKGFFPICDYDNPAENDNPNPNRGEIANLNKTLLGRLQVRKAYATEVPKDNLKEMVMLCLTDTTFPSYVAEIDTIIKELEE